MTMKTNPIKLNIFRNDFSVSDKSFQPSASSAYSSAPIFAKQPQINCLSANYYSPVNFKAIDNNLFTEDLKNLDNIHCPICGVSMKTKNGLNDLVNEGQRILSVKNFVSWLEKNREHIPQKYQNFVESAKRISQEFSTESIEILLEKMRDTAIIASENAIEDMKNIIVEGQKNHHYTDSENVLLDECFVRLEEFEPDKHDEILKPIGKILYETIGAIQDKESKKIYSDLLTKIIPAAEYQKLFYKNEKIFKNLPYKKTVLVNLFKKSLSNPQNIIPNFDADKDPNINSILICKDCTPKKDCNIFRHYMHKEGVKENFTKYIEDVSKSVMENELNSYTNYPHDLVKYVNKLTQGSISLNKYDTPTLRALDIKTFHEKQKEIGFEPLNHSGIPCSSCGGMTITHDEKVELFEKVKETKNLKELLQFLEDNEEIINYRFKSFVKIFQEQMKENPDISEKELLNKLKIYSAERIKLQLAENCVKAQKSIDFYDKRLTAKDIELIQEYIKEINKNFLNISNFKTFPYREYSDLLKRTIYLVDNDDYKNIYGTKLKENIRKKYIKQTILYPNKNTVEKVGTVMKVIVQDILKGSVATLDHLMARDRAGWESIPNYVVMCKNCNNEKANYSFSHWSDINKRLNVSMNKYIKKIIDLYNDGKLSEEYKSYPYILAKGLNVLSKGKIILKFKINATNRNKDNNK